MSIVYQPEEVIQDKYCITGVLGRGGVAITYSAVNLETNSPIAIKVISLKQLDNWKQVELFAREAEVLKHLNHSAIPKYIDYFDIETDTDKVFYLVQEIAPGKSLFELVESGWRTNEREVKNIAQQILFILSYLHSLDPPVIHRDIKPNNIIRDDNGKIYLVDFGAVQNTYYDTLMQGSTVVGTYGYMSPEQFRGKALPQSDLYSLGATLLYLLTHRSPAELPQDTLKLNFRNYVDISDNFADWLEKILEPDLEDRFSSADVASVELFKTKKKKQKKLLVSVSTVVFFVGLFAGFNSYKWFFLSRIGFNPSDICSAKTVRTFLNQGGSFNRLSKKNKINVLAHIISKEKQENAIKHLNKTKNLDLIINKGQTCKNSKNRTLLHRAILKNNIEVVKLLLDYGADANVKNGYVKPPIFNATYYGNLNIVKLLIEHGADINETDSTGKTPLFNAISQGHINIAKLLIESGVDIDARNRSNETALFKAVQKENIVLAEMLIAFGADVNIKSLRDDTPLSIAVASNRKNKDIAKLLIEHGAIDYQANETKLVKAIEKSSIEEVRQLINEGHNVNNRNEFWQTPLMLACKRGNKNIAELLIKNGANVNSLDISKQSSLSHSVSKGFIDVAQLLIKNGAEVNIHDKNNENPLFLAIVMRDKDMVRLLINNGAYTYGFDERNIERTLRAFNVQEKQKIKNFLNSNDFKINGQ